MAEQPDSTSIVRKILPFLSVAILIAAIYVGWIFYSRWDANREADRARSEKEAEDARQTVDRFGGGKFKILSFYALPGTVRRGDTSSMCYGVSEAKTVKITPDVEPIEPAFTHCVQVTPKKTTEYTLTAADSQGHTATQSLTLTVLR